MDMLSHLNRPGRWVLVPRRDERFLGPGGRARARARERRRRVFTVLFEAIALTGLIGAFPPLRAMWWVTAAFLGALVAYVYLLVRLGAPGSATAAAYAAPGAALDAPAPVAPNGNGNGHGADPAVLDGHGTSAMGQDDLADAGIRLLAR